MGRPPFRPSLIAAALAVLAAASPAPAQQPDSVDVAPAEGPAPRGPAFSPRGAFFRSLVLPGWGQAYVGAPGRGAVYFGLASGSLAMTYVARRELLDERRDADWRLEAGAPAPDPDDDPVLAAERRVEDWVALSVFVMFLAGADAYVAAYLADFDERLGVLPDPQGGVQLRVHLPVGSPP